MQAVKTIHFIVFFLLIINCDGQNLSGQYIRTNTAGSGTGMGFTFDKNGHFEETLFYHLEEKKIFKGNYYINKDTLTLTYQDLKTIKNVEYIAKTKYFKSHFTADIQVVDETGNPIQDVTFFLANKDHDPVIGFYSDQSGHFPHFDVADDYIKSLQFSLVAKADVSIGVDSLFGYHNIIKVVMQDASEIAGYMGPKKYLITEMSEKRIKMATLKEEKELIILTKK